MNELWSRIVRWLSGFTMIIDGASVVLTFGYGHLGLTGYLVLLTCDKSDEDEFVKEWDDLGPKREEEVIREQAQALLLMDDDGRMQHLELLRSNTATMVLVPKILSYMEDLRAIVRSHEHRDKS